MSTRSPDAQLLRSSAERAIRYLEDLHSRSVFPDARAIAGLAHLSSCLPDEPRAT